MDKDINRVLRTVNKVFETDLSLKNYEMTRIFDKEKTAPFERFLLSARLRPFLVLKVLDLLDQEETFYLGCKRLLYTYDDYSVGDEESEEEEEEEEEKVIIPPIIFNACTVKQAFSADEVFNTFLCKLAFSALIVGPMASFGGKMISEKGNVNPPLSNDYFGSREGDLYISEKLIILKDLLYIKKSDLDLKESVKNIIEVEKNRFYSFLEKYKEKGVPHSIYVEWLQTWFPKRIRIRALR